MTTSPRTERANYDRYLPLFHQLDDDSLTERERADVRDRLVAAHLPVANHIARRFHHRGQPVEDLAQVATIGLINAVDRFDPAKGNDFLSFAVPTITGEVRRYFRDFTWSVRVPRRLKELNAAVGVAANELAQRLNRAPRPSELAAELNLPVAEVRDGLAAGCAYRSDSLDAHVWTDSGAGSTIAELLCAEDRDLAAVDDRESLYPALAELPDRERTIVLLRFFDNLSQTQIAERVHLSQMHVSRLLSASLAELRARIEDPPDGPGRPPPMPCQRIAATRR